MHTNETTVYSALLIGAAIISIILGYFFFTLVYQQRKYRKFYTDQLNNEILLLENERRDIAAHLHDDFGPKLYIASMKLASIDVPDDKAMKLRDETMCIIDELTTKMRSFNKTLMPSSLLEKGLKPALEDFFNDVTIDYEIDLSFDVQDIPHFTPEITVHVYRIIQEIIFNTVKHSTATSLTIDLYEKEGNFIIRTADNGEGFDIKKRYNSPKGTGLKNIKNRVALLNGSIDTSSYKGKGTFYFISLPICKYEKRANNPTIIS